MVDGKATSKIWLFKAYVDGPKILRNNGGRVVAADSE